MPVAHYLVPYEQIERLPGQEPARRLEIDRATPDVGYWEEAEIAGNQAIVRVRATKATLDNLATSWRRVRPEAHWTEHRDKPVGRGGEIAFDTGVVCATKTLADLASDVLTDAEWTAVLQQADELMRAADKSGYVRIEEESWNRAARLLAVVAKYGYGLDRISTGTFPTTGVVDDFNRADGGVGANWSLTTGAGAVGTISSNRVTSDGTNITRNYWNPSTFGPDSEVQIKVDTKGAAGGFLTLDLRLQTPGSAAVDGYQFEADVSAGTDPQIIGRIDNNVFTQLGATVNNEFATGDRFGFEAIGSTLTGYRHDGVTWASLLSRTDSTYSGSGNIGWRKNSTNTDFLDNFGGGTVTAGAVYAEPARATASFPLVLKLSPTVYGQTAAATAAAPTPAVSGGGAGSATITAKPCIATARFGGALALDIQIVPPAAASTARMLVPVSALTGISAVAARATATFPAPKLGQTIRPPAMRATAVASALGVSSLPGGLTVSNIRLVVQAAFDNNPTASTYTWTTIGDTDNLPASYIRGFTYNRGRQNELGQVGAGTGTVVLRDRYSHFDPSNQASPFHRVAISNGDMESGTANWYALNSTVTSDATHVHGGASALKVVSSNLASLEGISRASTHPATTLDDLVAITPGVTYTMRIWVWGDGVHGLSMFADRYTDDLTLIRTTGGGIGVPAAGWNFFTHVFVAEATASWANLRVVTTAQTAMTFWIDDVNLISTESAVKPMLPFRALAYIGGTEYPMFLHYAERLPRTTRVTSVWTQRDIATVDGFGWLANADLITTSASYVWFAGQTSAIRIAATQYGTRGQDISVIFSKTGDNHGLRVSVAGQKLTIDLGTDHSGTPISTTQQVVDRINSDAQAAALVVASVATDQGGDGLGVPTLVPETHLVGGGFDVEMSGARLGNILDAVEWPQGLRLLDGGMSEVSATVGFGPSDNVKALAHLQDVAETTENGVAYINGAGQLRFIDRHAVLSLTESEATLADTSAAAVAQGIAYGVGTYGAGPYGAAAGGAVPVVDLVPSYDLDQVVNDWTVTATTGTPQQAVDTKSTAAYGPRPQQISTLAITENEALAQAQWKLRLFKDPLNRVQQVTAMPGNDLNYWRTLLALDVGSRITITETPPGFTSPQSADYIVEHVAVDVDVGPVNSTTFTYQLWPADDTPWMIFDDPVRDKFGTGVLAF